MPLRTFDWVFVAGFVVGSVVRRVGMGGARRERTASGGQTPLDTAFMALAAAGMLAAPLIHLVTPWLEFADYGPCAWSGWLGAGAFAAAMYVLRRSHADLDRNFAPVLRIREGHTLVTTGIYRRVRHPMYLAHWLWALAQALLLQNWIAGPAMLVAFLPLYVYRVPREEALMLGQFGDEYRDYMGRTGRLLPRVRE